MISTGHTPRWAAGVSALVATLGLAAAGSAQGLPTRPVSLAGGRVTLGAELSATWGGEDEGYFNHTGYDQSTLRRVRAGLSASVRATRQWTFLSEVRVESGANPRIYAAYVRFQPWATGTFSIQAGRIPPTFGAYARRSYPQDNPLIGDPLPYQYLTSVRPDAAPATAADLLNMRGRGWRLTYPVGNGTPAPGVPMVSALDWDTGVEVRTGSAAVELAAALTAGSLSEPHAGDGKGGPQLAARLAVSPVVGLVIGASAARGRFATKSLRDVLPAAMAASTQTAFGVDGEYSRGHWLVRGECIANAWRLPVLAAPPIPDPLRVVGGYAEGRYRLLPQLYLAARVDRLSFAHVAGTEGAVSWDADVTRVEAGAGYYLRRNVIIKVAWQHNARDGGRVRRNDLGAAQILYWF